MSSSLYIAASGLNTYQKKLDTISNNIANVDTTGYKRRETSFEENLAISIENQKARQQEIGRGTPFGIREGFGVHVSGNQLILDQGVPKATDNPFDLMIMGKGYFRVGKQQAGGNEVLYTRDGAFQKSPTTNNSYRLTNAQGYFLLDQNNNPIEIPNGSDFIVTENGTIGATNQQLGVTDFINPQKLSGEGGNMYRFTGNENELIVMNTSEVKQGYLESSNVDLSKEVTDMITTQRGFQFNSRSISFADQMMGIANGIIRS
ncbi:flagellar hook-basal body protein [Neobacillus sp. LXY-4]|uniref:flagellar hook-basal body protein n=1 Tax=Neobacillus sp. LXY-4 TaxID=3379826 RepID=UPI003EE3760E